MDNEQEEHSIDNTGPGTKALHYAGVAFFRLFESLIALIPVSIVCRIGMAAGWLAYYILPSRRRIVARNLRIVIDPALRGRELNKLVKKNFVRTVMNLLASTKTATMSDKALSRHTTLLGVDTFDDPDVQEHGLICLVAHSGNWELLSRSYTFFPKAKKYGSMYRQMENPLLEEYLYAKRTNNGAHMFSKEGGVAAPLSFIKTGGGLGILCDQYVQEGVFVPYFGKVTGTTYLPALMQKRTRARMKPCVVGSRKPGQWVCYSTDGLGIEDSTGSLAGDTIAVNRALERELAKTPLDGFWMHHRWKVFNNFAPQDAKALKALEGLDLKPFRILFATPLAFEEAVICTPIVKILKNCRRDMQINIICPEEQAAFWKQMGEVDNIISQGDIRHLRRQLFEPSLYDHGPYDIAFLFDNSKSTVKALAPFRPVTFSGFDSHPCSHRREFRSRAIKPAPGRLRHRIEDYLLVMVNHGLYAHRPEYYPSRKTPDCQGDTLLLSPCSTLGKANEWSPDNWRQLLQLLPGEIKPMLIALPQQREQAEQLASDWQIPCHIGDATGLMSVMDSAHSVIAVDGLIPSLAAQTGTPCVTLFSTRLPGKYRPLGSFHESLNRHRPCAPCYLAACDQKTACVNDISPQMTADAWLRLQSRQG